ncbi:MAG: hypothetical protein H6733_07640 [Alphaproteobacteria bacterium]|nr:hypothetical protein [Alphaproteobacteria bacterium]
MTTRRTARALLGSATRVGTLVVIGVAETACNLQIGDIRRDTSPQAPFRDSGDTDTDTGDSALSDSGTDTDTDGVDTDTDAIDTDTDGIDTDPLPVTAGSFP